MAGSEVPGVLGLEEAGTSGGHDDQEADDAAQERRELGAEEDRDQQVRDDEGHGGEEREGGDGQAGAEALLLTEEARHEAYEDQRDHEAADRVEGGDLYSGVCDECRLLRDPELRHPVQDRLGEASRVTGQQSLSDACEHRGADCTEAHRHRLDDEAREYRGDRGEPECEQQRRDDGCGGSEAGGALDEAAEQERDDDDLDAAIRRDGDEAGLDRVDRTGFRQGGEEQERSEDDPEEAEGHDDPLDHRCADRDDGDAPAEERHEGCDDQRRRHRDCGGGSEDEQQYARYEDG